MFEENSEKFHISQKFNQFCRVSIRLMETLMNTKINVTFYDNLSINYSSFHNFQLDMKTADEADAS